MSKRNNNLKSLVLCAILVALAAALGMIKILHLPYGGSITLLSMLACTLCGYYCGLAKGLTSGLALGLLSRESVGPEDAFIHLEDIVF